MESDQSVHVEYGGKPLEARQRYYWRVKVWDKHGNESDWSEPVWWEMGLLDEDDWRAEWISFGGEESQALHLHGAHWIWYPEGTPGVDAPVGLVYFRYGFELPVDQELAKAEMLLTADDVFVLYVNGELVDNSPQVPDAWKQARLVDVTDRLHPGRNVIAVVALNAEATGYNNPAGLIGRMRITYDEDQTHILDTSAGWKTSKIMQPDWHMPEFDDSDWERAVEIAPYGSAIWGNQVQLPYDATPLSFDGLKWVWYPEGNPAQAAPQGDRYFRKTFLLPVEREITRAQFLLTADDWFILYVNGERVASSPRVFEAWKEALLIDVDEALQPGVNTVAIEVTNDESAAGIIGRLRIEFMDGEPLDVPVDHTWKAAQERHNGWDQSGFNDSDWPYAIETATYGSGPWGSNVKMHSGQGAPYLRRSFVVEKPIERARLYSTALGVYEPYLNGERVGKDIFAPGWTDYHTRIQYQTYDVTELLQNGENVLGAMLGVGWYAGHVGLVGHPRLRRQTVFVDAA